MLSQVTIVVALVLVVHGSVVPETSPDGNRHGRYIWEKFFNKKGTTDTPTEDYEGGDVTIGPDGGDFFNPEGLDGGRPTGTVDVTRQGVDRESDQAIAPTYITFIATVDPLPDAVQMVVTINSIYLFGPDDGDCVNDTVVINGGNPGPEIPVLCGRFSDQKLYVGIDNNGGGPIQIIIKLLCCVFYPAEWNISVNYLTKADAALPRRCLQYHTALSGKIESFNYDLDTPGMMINEQRYSICFGYVVGYCNIAFNFERLDLGRIEGICTADYLLIGDDKFCGDEIGTTIIANATAPIEVGVRTGSVNEIEEEGFSATYTMMGC